MAPTQNKPPPFSAGIPRLVLQLRDGPRRPLPHNLGTHRSVAGAIKIPSLKALLLNPQIIRSL